MTRNTSPQALAARGCIGPARAGPARLGLLGALICLALPCAVATAADPQARLRDRLVQLQERLRTNQFGLPLVLDSTETADRLQGDIYAVVAHPLDKVSTGLGKPQHWCDVMILHINTKYCHAVTAPAGTTLRVNIGTKKPESLAASSRIEFGFDATATTPDYFSATLAAKDGPLGTSDYHIQLEAIALPQAGTFLHLSYSYASDFGARLAMKGYLSTIGRNKVGFTASGLQADGKASYIGGLRGVVERNTMRYYLAIDSFLGALDVAPEARLEHRLQNWFTAVERYPRQLHEMERTEYLDMKRAEVTRQQTLR